MYNLFRVSFTELKILIQGAFEKENVIAVTCTSFNGSDHPSTELTLLKSDFEAVIIILYNFHILL